MFLFEIWSHFTSFFLVDSWLTIPLRSFFGLRPRECLFATSLGYIIGSSRELQGDEILGLSLGPGDLPAGFQ